jgi:hypothetical protein
MYDRLDHSLHPLPYPAIGGRNNYLYFPNWCSFFSLVQVVTFLVYTLIPDLKNLHGCIVLRWKILFNLFVQYIVNFKFLTHFLCTQMPPL